MRDEGKASSRSYHSASGRTESTLGVRLPRCVEMRGTTFTPTSSDSEQSPLPACRESRRLGRRSMNALRYVHLSSRDSGAGLEEVFIRRFRFEHGDSVYDGLRLFILVFLDQEAKRCSFLADAVGALSSFRQVQTLTGGKPATKQEVVKFPEPTPCKQLHQEAARAGFNSLAIQAISSAPGGAL